TQDIQVRVRFDRDHAMLLVADATDGKEAPPTELRQRSKGFKTFLSFFVNCGDVLGKADANTILLLDEPGLHLHADQQRELLAILEEASKRNPIVYTSHSPWMLPDRALHTIKAIEKTPDKATIVNDRWWKSGSD